MLRPLRISRRWAPGWFLFGGGGGLASVQTDATLTGAGTVASPLSIAGMLEVGAIASLPVSGQATGARYRCTDSPYEFIWTGSAWQAFAYGFAVTPPVLANFTQVNVGASTFDTTHGGIIQTVASGASTNDVQVLAQAIPGSGTYFVDAAATYWTNGPNGGFGVGMSAGTLTSNALESAVYPFAAAGFDQWEALVWSNVNAGAGVAAGPFQPFWHAPMMWFRVEDDRTNLYYSVSPNGYTWHQYYQHARTSNFTPAQTILAFNRFTCGGIVHWLHFSIHT